MSTPPTDSAPDLAQRLVQVANLLTRDAATIANVLDAASKLLQVAPTVGADGQTWPQPGDHGGPALRLDDGTVHWHVAGQVRRDIIATRQAGTGDTTPAGDADRVIADAIAKHWGYADANEAARDGKNGDLAELADVSKQALAAAGLLTTRPDWQAAFWAKQREFTQETLRVSALLARCDRNNIPRHVVGEALLGWEAAQEHIRAAAQPARQEPSQGAPEPEICNGLVGECTLPKDHEGACDDRQERSQDTEGARPEPFATQSDCCDDLDCPCHDNDDPIGDQWADDVAAADRPAAGEEIDRG
jgi:hypothetical protein